jgi:hypothetical protein
LVFLLVVFFSVRAIFAFDGGHLIIPAVNTEVTVGDRILQLGAVQGTTVGSQLAAEVRIVIRTGLVEGSHISVASAPLAVGLGVVGVQVVASGESAVAAGNPANVWLLLGVALHVALQVLLTLKATLATGLLALELDLLDDRGQVLQAQVGANQLLFG